MKESSINTEKVKLVIDSYNAILKSDSVRERYILREESGLNNIYRITDSVYLHSSLVKSGSLESCYGYISGLMGCYLSIHNTKKSGITLTKVKSIMQEVNSRIFHLNSSYSLLPSGNGYFRLSYITRKSSSTVVKGTIKECNSYLIHILSRLDQQGVYS